MKYVASKLFSLSNNNLVHHERTLIYERIVELTESINQSIQKNFDF